MTRYYRFAHQAITPTQRLLICERKREPQNCECKTWTVLAALAPQAGVRMIAEMFNRKFEVKRRMTVSKSYVATALKKHRLSILHMRRELKNRIPREMPKNRLWGIDLTTITDDAGVQHLAFGVLDHGSRLSIALELIGNKRTTTLLWILLQSFAKFGKPHVIRADNESCFRSRLMRATLAALGVKLQHITPLSPWENGRIERFFGTLKHALATALVPTMSVQAKLQWFRNYYNHVHGWVCFAHGKTHSAQRKLRSAAATSPKNYVER